MSRQPDTFEGPFGTVRCGTCSKCHRTSHILSQREGVCPECSRSAGAQVPSREHLTDVKKVATPRTDAVATDGWSGDAVAVPVEFARELERELASLETHIIERQPLKTTTLLPKSLVASIYDGDLWVKVSDVQPVLKDLAETRDLLNSECFSRVTYKQQVRAALDRVAELESELGIWRQCHSNPKFTQMPAIKRCGHGNPIDPTGGYVCLKCFNEPAGFCCDINAAHPGKHRGGCPSETTGDGAK